MNLRENARKDEDEYWRHKLIDEVIGHSFRSASKNLKRYVASVRKDDEAAERAEKAAKERAERATEELERQEQSYSDTSSSDDSSDSSSSSGGGGHSGYTGPRCYAPGGKTWKPC
jgi:micrococcal nuclease